MTLLLLLNGSGTIAVSSTGNVSIVGTISGLQTTVNSSISISPSTVSPAESISGSVSILGTVSPSEVISAAVAITQSASVGEYFTGSVQTTDSINTQETVSGSVQTFDYGIPTMYFSGATSIGGTITAKTNAALSGAVSIIGNVVNTVLGWLGFVSVGGVAAATVPATPGTVIGSDYLVNQVVGSDYLVNQVVGNDYVINQVVGSDYLT